MSRPPRFFFWLIVVLVAAGVGALAVNVLPSFGYDLSSPGSVRFVYLVAILVFVASAFAGRRVSFGQIVRGFLGWTAILIVALGAYAYRSELAGVGGRLLGVLAPGIPISGRLTGEAEGSVVIVRAADGHFAVRASANGVPMLMLIDTGASFVTLTPADAAAVGIDTANLDFATPIQTANGMIGAAPVTHRQHHRGQHRTAERARAGGANRRPAREPARHELPQHARRLRHLRRPPGADAVGVQPTRLSAKRAATKSRKSPKPISSCRRVRAWAMRTPKGAAITEIGMTSSTPTRLTKPAENGGSAASFQPAQT